MAGSSVRVDPPSVEFSDVKVGQVYRVTVKVRNVGKTSAKISFGKPSSKLFKFTASSPPVVVAPGLSVSGLLEFTPKEEEEIIDHLQIHIDDVETKKIPLLGFPRASFLSMDSVLDFGCVVASNQVISKRHPITNQGSAPGVFQVQYKGDCRLNISPTSGVIAAGTTQWLKVELRTDRPRQLEEKALVKLQNRSAVVLSVRAEVVDQYLEVFDLQGTPLSCLWFGPVYFGTCRVENVVLRNNSPQPCDWVCLLQDTAAGTELGTDLQKSTDAALLERMKCSPATRDTAQVLTLAPKQGQLGPYDKTTVAVCFSPICESEIENERKKHDHSACRQDYCLYLLFECVGSKHGFTHDNANSSVELAVTGSGLHVSLVLSPSCRFDFLSCAMGQRVDRLCILQNLCPQLPVSFFFPRLAHFNTKPSTGTIAPGQSQDVVLSFIARQQGSFQMRQKLDILGYVCQKDGKTIEDVSELKRCSFHSITLYFSAICHSKTTHPISKLPSTLITPVGSWPHIQHSELALHGRMACAAILSADKAKLHLECSEKSQNTTGEKYMDFSDDQAPSLGLASLHKQYRTVSAGIPTHCYVDTKYAFTEQEEVQRQHNRQIYADFIKRLRQTRLQGIKERQQEKVEDVDIGIVPAQGLVPPVLHINNLDSNEIKLKYNCTSPGTKRSCPQGMTSISQNASSQSSKVLHAIPSTSQEVADCNRILTAEELYQVSIGPSLVDLGNVCVQSVCVQKLDLINHLSAYISVKLEVGCPELQCSSPLSHVLPPHSHNTLYLTFQSSKLGPFYGLLPYSVNQRHPGQIVVEAQVIPPALELSTNQLVLHPTPNLLATSGFRSSITLRNQCNTAVEFTWRPVVTESGIMFSVRPATGAVEPYRELDCEVVWHPSFSSPSEGDFDLCVHKGNTQRLHCVAKVGATSVQLAEKRITFGSVPLNMPSIRTAVLHNTGQNHAYFQILDVCPLPGMVVSPSEGVVPSKGQAILKIHFNPDSLIKFDTTIEIALRKMKSIELRVGGSVEPPNVDISVSHFQFNGVYSGSQRVIPFTLTNHSSAAAWVTFDLSEYKDFFVQLPQHSQKWEPGVTVVDIQGYQAVNCCLAFSPTQMASYDFDLPLMVNGVRWPPACLSPLPTPSSSLTAGSRKPTVKQLSYSAAMMSQRPSHIQATVLCAPLEMSPSCLQFHVEPQSKPYAKKVELKAACQLSSCWHGVIDAHVDWWFDCSTEESREKELCVVSPSSGSLWPGQSICLEVSIRSEAVRTGSGKVTKLSLPLYLGDKGIDEQVVEKGHQPYRELSVTITLQLPSIIFEPPQILLMPVPLQSNTATTLTLHAVGYPSGTSVSAEVDEVELEDGRRLQPVSVIFPEGNTIPAQEHNRESSVTSLLCSVSFCSAVPLSLCTTITFSDHMYSRFKIKLNAIADNCLLTVWPYLALHQSEQQIVLKTGATAIEVVLQSYETLSPVTGSTSPMSSFDHSSSTKKKSESLSDTVSGQASREISSNRDTLVNLCIPEFPASNSEEGLYYQNVLLAVERWFSLFGWPSGPHPITIPHTLRRVVTKIQTQDSNGRTYRVSQNIDSRSVVDMLYHLIGKHIPGIPLCQTFSGNIDQRTCQLLQQHEAMLDFLRIQGACLCHIRPEYLLDVLEFRHWCSLQSNHVGHNLDYNSVDYESLSKRSWTDVLLQIYKVLVLRRVSMNSLNTTLNHNDNGGFPLLGSQSINSNVYSSWELQLLSWLNAHYQRMRKTLWGTSRVPSVRWIINFDLDLTDGLVLASLLAAYCPYLIESHFQRMYTTPSSLEQILHNNIIVVQALTALCLNISVQPTDLTDPNPVQMLILCVHLYERLPQYVPKNTITLSGGLHRTVSKKVRLKSPSSKTIKYTAFVLGKDAHLFSLPDGSIVTVPPKSSAELTVRFSCSFLEPMEAVLLLISTATFGLCCTTLALNLKTHISHITPTNTVKCCSPCYQLKVIQVPIMNTFRKEAEFRVVLVESTFDPLESETKQDCIVQQTSSKFNMEKMTSDKMCVEEMEDEEGSEFLSTLRSVHLKSSQADNLSIYYLPFCPGTKYCSVLLVCPQVGDMVYIVKATSELPPPSPLTAKSRSSISNPKNPDVEMCVSVLSLHCKVGQVCEEVLQVPRINVLWEQALAIWGQHRMCPDEQRRRLLTRTLHSSTVRETVARQKLFRGVYQSDGVKYRVEVSLPQYFTLPNTVTIPVKEYTRIPLENPADCGYVDIPLRFQADSVGQFRCQVVLRSWYDTRVYLLEALVSSKHNERHQDWKMQAEVGVGENLLPVDHVVLHCPVGKTTHTLLDVPNYSQKKLTLKVVTDLSIVCGSSSLEIKPGLNAPYALAVSPWKRGKQTGYVSFLEAHDLQQADKEEGNASGHYKVHFTLEIICEPAAPIKIIEVHCAAQSSVAIEIPVNNPGGGLLTLDVYLQGDDLTGANWILVPPQETVTYKAIFSPSSIGKSTGSVVFQSQLVGEFWYHLELYALPPPVLMLPQVCCQLGKWTRLTVPLVNPTAETLELVIANSNPRNYKLEMNSGNTVIVDPHSSTQLGVRFSPSAIGEENHSAKIAFTCPQLQEWCVLLSGRGLKPEREVPLNISSLIGSKTSITIPFTNPTELPAALSITLTDEDPSTVLNCDLVPSKGVFSIPLIHTEDVQLNERETFDVPVVFAPISMELQHAWLCITMKPISSLGTNTNFHTDSMRPEQELSTLSWIYPLCGIPTEPETSTPDTIQCEVGCQLEKKVDVLLTGCVPENQDQEGQEVTRVMKEDFLCEVRTDSGEECSEVDFLSVSVDSARRDPENGIITLTLNLVFIPLRTCRCSRVLAVRAVSGKDWEFPITLIATESQVDDVILTETTELGKTSAVGFRLTSTIGRPVPFTAAFLPGSSSEFTVTPISGTLPPVGSSGALITVFFTPTSSCKVHRARLAIQAADMQWTYEVRGKTPQDAFTPL